jgi:hypothetical protein
VRVRKLLLPIAIMLAPAAVATAGARATPILLTNQSCYLVGQPVGITGSGFAASRMYEVALDGLDFGISTTNADGGFTASLSPGGLGANVVQAVDALVASDGTSQTRTTFTVTRTAGARILAGSGAAASLRAPFQVWGFALGGSQRPVYLHYVSPRGHLKVTVALGNTGGQCGYLRTKARRVFPFLPGHGTWTLQLDTHPGYSRHASGPVAKIVVRVG